MANKHINMGWWNKIYWKFIYKWFYMQFIFTMFLLFSFDFDHFLEERNETLFFMNHDIVMNRCGIDIYYILLISPLTFSLRNIISLLKSTEIISTFIPCFITISRIVQRRLRLVVVKADWWYWLYTQIFFINLVYLHLEFGGW